MSEYEDTEAGKFEYISTALNGLSPAEKALVLKMLRDGKTPQEIIDEILESRKPKPEPTPANRPRIGRP